MSEVPLVSLRVGVDRVMEGVGLSLGRQSRQKQAEAHDHGHKRSRELDDSAHGSPASPSASALVGQDTLGDHALLVDRRAVGGRREASATVGTPGRAGDLVQPSRVAIGRPGTRAVHDTRVATGLAHDDSRGKNRSRATAGRTMTNCVMTPLVVPLATLEVLLAACLRQPAMTRHDVTVCDLAGTNSLHLPPMVLGLVLMEEEVRRTPGTVL